MLRNNAEQLARAWLKREQALRPLMQKATAEATKTLYAESRRQMTKGIYDKDVPTKGQIAAEQGLTVDGKPAGFVKVKGRKGGGAGKHTILMPLSPKYAKRKAWRRTGNLRRSERFKVLSAYVGVVDNTAKTGKGYAYAKRRHDMESRFPAPWRRNAIRITRPKIRRIYQEAIKEAMNAGFAPRVNIE